MAGFSSEIILKEELRPCFVENKKALFHKWVHIKNLLGQEFENGIIEYEDGQVEEVKPNDIKFIDNKTKEYDFG